MKAVVIRKPGSVSVVKMDSPRPASGEVLIRIQYVGFCGSDLSTFLGKNPMVQYPRVPGHEISGIIEEKGIGVPEELHAGDLVTVIPYTSCGQCVSCRRGRYNACRHNQTLGVQRDGAMQEYITVPWQKVLKAPGLNELELVMVEPLTVGFHAIDRGGVEKSDVVMVLGCGMIGAGAIAGALQCGAKVIAVDVDDHKLDLAGKLGAHHAINSVKENLHETLAELTGGEGPDVVIEAAGNPVTYRAAVDEVAFTGRVVCIGYTGSEVSFATRLFVQKEIDIRGSRNATPDDFRRVIEYLEQGDFPLENMITRIVKPDEAANALREWTEEPGSVMNILVDFKP
ncbi:MAG: zinc-binding alcohol dehydrogenase family protein [Bacteroidales bacterium]|nr:zinc-binding alcohol dehydrogenase family protein [Bacteroidales bacterium]